MSNKEKQRRLEEPTEQNICVYHGKPSRRSGLGCPDCYEDHPVPQAAKRKDEA